VLSSCSFGLWQRCAGEFLMGGLLCRVSVCAEGLQPMVWQCHSKDWNQDIGYEAQGLHIFM
jgi:hypothetical protein